MPVDLPDAKGVVVQLEAKSEHFCFHGYRAKVFTKVAEVTAAVKSSIVCNNNENHKKVFINIDATVQHLIWYLFRYNRSR